jgi:hypothetical protein
MLVILTVPCKFASSIMKPYMSTADEEAIAQVLWLTILDLSVTHTGARVRPDLEKPEEFQRGTF